MTTKRLQLSLAPVLRLWGWWALTAVLLAVIGALAPHQIEVIAYKAALLALGVKFSYWADRALFANVPPIAAGMSRDAFGAARLLCRALIALAVILGLTTGI